SSYGVYFRRYDANGVALDAADVLANTTIANDQNVPAVAMDAAGNFIIVWSSNLQDDPSSKGIYAQRFNANGTRNGGEFLVNTTTAANQDTPTAAMNSAGNCVIAGAQDGVNEGTYAQP